MQRPRVATPALARRVAGLVILAVLLWLALLPAPAPQREAARPAATARRLVYPRFAMTDSAAAPDTLSATDFELSQGIRLDLGLPIEAAPPPPPPKPATEAPPDVQPPAPPAAAEDTLPPPPEIAPLEVAAVTRPAESGGAPTDSAQSSLVASDAPTEMTLHPRVMVQPRSPEKIILKRKIDASVQLQARVGADGLVREIRVLQGIPNCAECDASAVAALQQYSFDPPALGPGVDAVWTTPFTIRFTYRGER